MNSLIYLLQVSACTCAFYLFYHLFLRHLTFFTINRWYLLITIVLSFAIPAIKITVTPQHPYLNVVHQAAAYITPVQMLPETFNPIVKNTLIAESTFSWLTVIKQLYFGLIAILTTHLLISVIVLFRRLNVRKRIKTADAIILECDHKLGAGSFFKYIFLNTENLSPDAQQQVIIHEMLHARLYHSADRIVAKLAQLVLWFNPFIYFYIWAIEANHEFEVDREMALSTDKNNYANLLLDMAINGRGSIFNNFSKAPLKGRIKMLFTKPSNNMKKAIYLLTVPVVLISCLAFARLKNIQPIPATASAHQQQQLPTKYRQKVKISDEERKQQARFEAYRKTDDYKNKYRDANEVFHKDISVVVSAAVKNKETGKTEAFMVKYNGKEYELRTAYGQEKQLINLLNVGDNINMKVFSSGYSENKPVSITPAYVYKDNKKIFQLVEADKLPDYPFLYERNKVRFADGQISHIVKYPNGKWKTAVFEIVNGYKFYLSFKPDAPDLNGIEWGDHLRLRFVHEVKTAAKEYRINDWVSISKDEQDYGVKNPDFFNKFYTAI